MNVKSLSAVICFHFTVIAQNYVNLDSKLVQYKFSQPFNSLLFYTLGKDGVLVNHFETKL